jgi:hypothetical protein
VCLCVCSSVCVCVCVVRYLCGIDELAKLAHEILRKYGAICIARFSDERALQEAERIRKRSGGQVYVAEDHDIIHTALATANSTRVRKLLIQNASVTELIGPECLRYCRANAIGRKLAGKLAWTAEDREIDSMFGEDESFCSSSNNNSGGSSSSSSGQVVVDCSVGGSGVASDDTGGGAAGRGGAGGAGGAGVVPQYFEPSGRGLYEATGPSSVRRIAVVTHGGGGSIKKRQRGDDRGVGHDLIERELNKNVQQLQQQQQQLQQRAQRQAAAATAR